MPKDRINRSEKYQWKFNEIETDFTSEFGRNITDDNDPLSIEDRLIIEELALLEEKLAKAFLPAIKPLLTEKQYETSEAAMLDLTQVEIGKLFHKNQSSVVKCFSGNIVYEDGKKVRYGGIANKLLKNIDIFTTLMPIIKEIDKLYDPDLPIRMPFYSTLKRLFKQDKLYNEETEEDMAQLPPNDKQIQDMRLLKSQGQTNAAIANKFNVSSSTVHKYTQDVSKPKKPPHPLIVATQLNYTKPLAIEPTDTTKPMETLPEPIVEQCKQCIGKPITMENLPKETVEAIEEVRSGNLPTFNSMEDLLDELNNIIKVKLPEHLFTILEQIVSEKNKDRYRYFDVSTTDIVRMAVIDYIKHYEQNQCVVKE